MKVECPGCYQPVFETSPACPHCQTHIYVEHPADIKGVKHAPLDHTSGGATGSFVMLLATLTFAN